MSDLARAARGGLCAACKHAQLVRSSKGSCFVLCRHPQTPKYPGQPVLTCRFFEAGKSFNRNWYEAILVFSVKLWIPAFAGMTLGSAFGMAVAMPVWFSRKARVTSNTSSG